MRIILSCLQGPGGYPIPAYDFWRGYLKNGCHEAGIECLEVADVDWAAGLALADGPELEKWKANAWALTSEFAREAHGRSRVDLFLGYLYPRQVEAGAIQEMQRIGIPCVNFFCDNVREFHTVPREFSPFDLHWVPEFEALSMYRSAGFRHVHAPMPCWVPPHLRDVPEAETECATFVGSADALRRDLIARAVEAGAALVVRGPGWSEEVESSDRRKRASSRLETLRNQVDAFRERGAVALITKVRDRLFPLRPRSLEPSLVRPAVWGEEYARVLREASVCLGINRVPSWKATLRKPLRYSRLRDLEAPMLGACYLTEWTEGLEHLFEPGEEIATYRSASEMAAKIQELGADFPRRRRMRRRAQERALAEHSVPRSMGRIFKSLGIRENR